MNVLLRKEERKEKRAQHLKFWESLNSRGKQQITFLKLVKLET